MLILFSMHVFLLPYIKYETTIILFALQNKRLLLSFPLHAEVHM
jgi:hypothetical protein